MTESDAIFAEKEPRLAPSVRVVQHGDERQSVVIVDNFFPEPQRLIDDACELQFRRIGQYYPGVRAPANPAHLEAVSGLLETILREVFGVRKGVHMEECNYSLVTTPPEDLAPIQRLPHFDSTDRNRIALLHYLCRPEQGGTNFYRHRSTQFETITPDRFENYRDRLNRESNDFGIPPAEYFLGETDQFEQIASYSAVFNRALIYRGISLHSGAIPSTFEGSEDPRLGRLTVNTFFIARG